MNTLPKWFTTFAAGWVSIGALLIAFGFKGGPDWLPVVFSEPFVQASAAVLGAIITYFQYLKGVFVAKIIGTVHTFKAGALSKFYWNPFKATI